MPTRLNTKLLLQISPYCSLYTNLFTFILNGHVQEDMAACCVFAFDRHPCVAQA